MVCSINLLCYGLPNLFEFESNHLSSLSCKQKMNYENSNLGGKYNDIGFEIGLPLADIYLVLVYYNYFFQHHIKVKTHIFFRSAPKFFFQYEMMNDIINDCSIAVLLQKKLIWLVTERNISLYQFLFWRGKRLIKYFLYTQEDFLVCCISSGNK